MRYRTYISRPFLIRRNKFSIHYINPWLFGASFRTYIPRPFLITRNILLSYLHKPVTFLCVSEPIYHVHFSFHEIYYLTYINAWLFVACVRTYISRPFLITRNILFSYLHKPVTFLCVSEPIYHVYFSSDEIYFSLTYINAWLFGACVRTYKSRPFLIRINIFSYLHKPVTFRCVCQNLHITSISH